MSRRRRLLFAAITLSASLGIALALGEWALRQQRRAIETSERMDPGLIEYDATLGWRLARRWSGRHVHHDFEVRYETNAEGFRGPVPRSGSGQRVVLLGDSFTFGLGVEEEDTFAARLRTEEREVLNCGVPGYSTDQEVLLYERTVRPLAPDVVVLVVCLVNDLFDNARAFPLQAPYAKPYFSLEADTLALHGIPVPRDRKPEAQSAADLAELVVGDDVPRPSGLAAWLGRREIFRRLGLFQSRFEPRAGYFQGRFDAEIRLFAALVDRLLAGIEAGGGKLIVALLPGRSSVQEPGGYSAGYQDHLARALERHGDSAGWNVVDLSSPLREAADAGLGLGYHPHEGHLDAAGHARVAARLVVALAHDASSLPTR